MTSDAVPARRGRGRPGHDREAVLRQAIELFNQQGYDATSISELARSLGVTKSAIYHHFDSKEALLAGALDEALGELSAAVDGAVAADHESAARRLRATIVAAVEILVAHRPAVTLLLRVHGNSPLEQDALRRRRHIDEQLATVVERAVAEGELRTDIDPTLVSRLAFGMVNSLADWYRPDGSLEPSDLAEVVASLLFDGLQSE